MIGLVIEALRPAPKRLVGWVRSLMMHGYLMSLDDMTLAQLDRLRKLTVTQGDNSLRIRTSNTVLQKKLKLALRTCFCTHGGTACSSSSTSRTTRWTG